MSGSAKSVVLRTPRENWITPIEQLQRLKFQVKDLIIGATQLLDNLAQIVEEYAQERKLMQWYRSLKKISKLPPTIPPLPLNIFQILNAPCPKQICIELKPDQTPYMLREKCTLVLLPQELQNINELKATPAPKKEKTEQEEKLFKFHYFWDAALEIYGEYPFEPTHWGLFTDSVLEGSRKIPYAKQLDLVRTLSKETSCSWEVPELRGAVAAIFLTSLGSESIYCTDIQQNGNVHTSTNLRERVCNLPLNACFPSEGLIIDAKHQQNGCENIGMGAVLKFY